MKLKLPQRIRGELLGNSKPTGTIIMMSQSETLSSSQIIFITLFSAGSQPLLNLLLATASCAMTLSRNHFPEPNWHILTFLHPILMCRITY
jgi:hypothetical protein